MANAIYWNAFTPYQSGKDEGNLIGSCMGEEIGDELEIATKLLLNRVIWPIVCTTFRATAVEFTGRRLHELKNNNYSY